MHKIRKIAHAAAGVTNTIVDMNRCILRACDVFWLVFADCAQCVFGQNAYTAQWILAKMHIPRYRRFAHCAQCCFGQNAYTALWAALRIARNAHLTDCAQCVLAILVLSAHMARYMQNRELPRARDAQAKILQCCGASTTRPALPRTPRRTRKNGSRSSPCPSGTVRCASRLLGGQRTQLRLARPALVLVRGLRPRVT